MDIKNLTRRNFLKVAGLLGIGAGVAACNPSAPPPALRNGYTENELPQPQEREAFGLLKTNPRPLMLSLKSIVMSWR